MTDADFRHDDLDTRRKRLRYRAWHRGTKEADLLIGPFADSELANMDHNQMDDFEAVLRLPDPALVRWLTGQEAIPDDANSPVMKWLLAFQTKS
ncbi:succinate dehydrogenase assembly factor 2 [Limibacillus halophilus]|uniref:FAD assembly factor SdhE n=1 Tax=Limibacillus halophilus TaxID=1579333 RepID=A0A839SX90_9PROT|nr:succinate dehydrogenase assembly factor 2 [Limibacillus halophilus]MBB3065615.1 antitoxin CptB [Limibacillus halophilus]